MRRVYPGTLTACAALAALICGAGGALAKSESVEQANTAPAVIKDGKIAFALTDRFWAIVETKDGKAECPNGLNEGPRDQFKQEFPDDGKERTLLETQLKIEGRTWFPDLSPEPFKFKEAIGKVAYGMNLDGKVKDSDFTSPDGENGIDNQLYRIIGCIQNYRMGGIVMNSENQNLNIRVNNTNRFLIEISGVDSLENDDDVTVNSYRGQDPIGAIDAKQAYLPGGVQHIDSRWGGFMMSTWKGKIVNGTLITDGADVSFPTGSVFSTSAYHVVKGIRFNLKLSPERAEGVMAGYADIEAFYRQLITSWSTHHRSYGLQSASSLYRAMYRLADGYPDPVTGKMTAISSALRVKFIQVEISRSPPELAQSSRALQRTAQSTAQGSK
jgi:hypothetical protein